MFPGVLPRRLRIRGANRVGDAIHGATPNALNEERVWIASPRATGLKSTRAHPTEQWLPGRDDRHSVKFHLKNIHGKLSVRRRTEPKNGVNQPLEVLPFGLFRCRRGIRIP